MNRTKIELPALISKKWLKVYYNVDYKTLARLVFTDARLEQLGMDRESYKKIRIFNLESSQIIRSWLENDG